MRRILQKVGILFRTGAREGDGALKLQQENHRLPIATLDDDTNQCLAISFDGKSLRSCTGSNALAVDIDIVALAGGNRNGRLLHCQFHFVNLLAGFQNQLLRIIAFGESNGGGIGRGAHFCRLCISTENVGNFRGLFICGTGDDIGGGDNLHIVEGHTADIHRVACIVHSPSQVKAAGGILIAVVFRVGVGGAVHQSVHIAKPGAAGKGAEFVIAGDALHAGDQDAGEGEGVLLRQRVQRVVLRQRPAEGTTDSLITVSIIVRPGGSGSVLAVGNGVVPQGIRIVMLGACQSIPGGTVLRDPHLTGFHGAEASAGRGILEGVAVNIEIHAVLVCGIVGQTFFKVVGDVTAEVTQRLQGVAAQGVLRIHTITTGIAVLAVDAQIINNLVGAVGYPLKVREAVLPPDRTIRTGDGNRLSAGGQRQCITSVLVGGLNLLANGRFGTGSYGIGQHRCRAAVGNGKLVAGDIRIKGRIPVADIRRGSEHLHRVGGGKLLYPDGVSSAIAGGNGFREGIAAIHIGLVADHLQDDLDHRVAFVGTLREGDYIRAASALGQHLPGRAFVHGVAHMDVGAIALCQHGKGRACIQQIGAVIQLSVVNSIRIFDCAVTICPEQISLCLFLILVSRQRAAFGVFHYNTGIIIDLLRGVPGTGNLEGIVRFLFGIQLVSQGNGDGAGAEGDIGQLRGSAGIHGNRCRFAVAVRIGRNCRQLLRVVQCVGGQIQAAGLISGKFQPGIRCCLGFEYDLLVDAVAPHVANGKSNILEGGLVSIGDDHLDAAGGSRAVSDGDDRGANGMPGYQTVFVHCGNGFIGTAPAGNGAAFHQVSRQLSGGGFVLTGQFQICLALIALGVLHRGAGDDTGGGVGQNGVIFAAHIHRVGDRDRTGAQQVKLNIAPLLCQIGGALGNAFRLHLEIPDIVPGDTGAEAGFCLRLPVLGQCDTLIPVISGYLIIRDLNDFFPTGNTGIIQGIRGQVGIAAAGDGIDTRFFIQSTTVALGAPGDRCLVTIFVHSTDLNRIPDGSNE